MPLKQNTLLHRAINHHYSTLQNHIGDWNRGTKPVREPGCSSWLEPTPGNLSKRRNEIAWECLIANRVLRSFLHLLMKEYISRRKKKKEKQMSKVKTKVLFALANEPNPRSETLSCASDRLDSCPHLAPSLSSKAGLCLSPEDPPGHMKGFSCYSMAPAFNTA